MRPLQLKSSRHLTSSSSRFPIAPSVANGYVSHNENLNDEGVFSFSGACSVSSPGSVHVGAISRQTGFDCDKSVTALQESSKAMAR
jgi:hypothetical protein